MPKPHVDLNIEQIQSYSDMQDGLKPFVSSFFSSSYKLFRCTWFLSSYPEFKEGQSEIILTKLSFKVIALLMVQIPKTLFIVQFSAGINAD